MVKKLSEGDKEQQKRIAELESRVGVRVSKEVEDKLAGAAGGKGAPGGGGGGAAAEALGHRLASIERQVAGELGPRVAAMAREGRGWVTPFVVLAVVVSGLGVWFLCFRHGIKKKQAFKLP